MSQGPNSEEATGPTARTASASQGAPFARQPSSRACCWAPSALNLQSEVQASDQPGPCLELIHAIPAKKAGKASIRLSDFSGGRPTLPCTPPYGLGKHASIRRWVRGLAAGRNTWCFTLQACCSPRLSGSLMTLHNQRLAVAFAQQGLPRGLSG